MDSDAYDMQRLINIIIIFLLIVVDFISFAPILNRSEGVNKSVILRPF